MQLDFFLQQVELIVSVWVSGRTFNDAVSVLVILLDACNDTADHCLIRDLIFTAPGFIQEVAQFMFLLDVLVNCVVVCISWECKVDELMISLVSSPCGEYRVGLLF